MSTQAPAIGFDRTIRRPWIDAAARMVTEGVPEAEIRHELRELLASELSGTDARRKVITVLLRIWIRPEGELV